MADLTLRPATRSDESLLHVFALRLTHFPLPPWRTPADIADADAGAMLKAVEAGSRDEEVVIAERRGEPVGCLHILLSTDFFGRRHAHLSVLATTERAEGTGVARALMAHAEGWTRRRGLTLLTLNVFAQNARARRFYELAGFAPE